MPDAASLSRRAPRAARVLSAEAARAKILAKLTKAGAKGSASIHAARLSDADRATYAAVLESLEAAEEIFVDRRKAKPKYYAWAARPVFPTAASVADELLGLCAQRFPVLTAESDGKKHLGKDAEKIALLPAALELLVAEKRLIALRHRSGKKELPLYIPSEAVRAALGTGPREPADLPTAYAAVVGRTGFPAVMVSELLHESGAELPALHRWLLAEHRAGRAVLSLGDWSLASGQQRAAALELQGERYLQVRLL